MSARSWANRRVLDAILRLFLGGFYVLAGALKVPNPGKFAEAVANYRLLPHEAVNLAAITLPWIEIVAGLFLIFGVWRLASAWLINGLTLMFIGAITSAVVRGLNVECGCFGTVGGRKVGLTAIAEDVVLLAVGLWLIWPSRQRPPAQPTSPEQPMTAATGH